MKSLNVWCWKSTKLHILRITGLKQNDLVIKAKVKIMELGQMYDLEEIELIYCGLIMEDLEPISRYIKLTNSMVLMVKKKIYSDEMEDRPTKDLQKMLEEYDAASAKIGFNNLMLRAITPETLSELLNEIPELSVDLVALTIIKNINLFETILERSVMKNSVTKHPALLMCADYLIRNKIPFMTGRIPCLVHLTDEDFSVTHDLTLDLHQANNSDPVLDFFYNTPNMASNGEEGNGRTYIRSSIFDSILMDALESRDAETGDESDNSPQGLSSQLLQMHELGLFDDLLNFRALQVTDGNVQEAVELILNRVIE